MGSNSNVITNIKDFLTSLLKSLGVGFAAGILARFAAFPIMAILHNRWIHALSVETVDMVYFWIGQLVGSTVFMIYMYSKLRGHDWSKPSSMLGVVFSMLILVISGFALEALLANR